MKKKDKDKNKDPNEKNYGLFQNMMYVLKGIIKHQKSLFFLMILYSFTCAAMSLMWTIIVKYILDYVQTALQTGNTTDFMPLLMLVLATTAVEIIMMGANTFCNIDMWWKFVYVRFKFISIRMAKSMSMKYEQLETPKMLDSMQKAMNATGNNTNGVEGLIRNLSSFMVAFVKIIASAAIIFTLNPIVVLIMLVLAFVQFLFFDYTKKKDKKEVWDAMAPNWRKTSYMENTSTNFAFAKDIRLFGFRNWLSKKHGEICDEKHRYMVKSKNYWIANSFFAHGISLLQEGILYAWLIYCVITKGMSIGDFTLYLGSIRTFSATLTDLLNSLADTRFNSMQVNDFRTFVEYPEDDESNCIDIPKCDKYVFTFENASFRYSGQENFALKNLNLTLEAGKRLAVVGLNGAGKTTFIKLLLRLYDVTEGRILLNGTDIRKFRRNDYYELFSPVFQNVEIFAFPLSENVSMKEPESTDKEKAERCLILSGMDEKLKALPKGVDTELLKVIYDDGIDLSGGEKQKLALARALYKNAPVVVLDEPTAALDALAEYKLYKDFDKLIGEKSAVYISHRLSSTRFCDSIAMFKAGEMVEYGTHEELLQKGGAYAEMFRVQAQYYQEEAVANG
ncbi:MAG: ABC transporter ATP-binding protein [Ruminiclostridium sp.]